MGTPATTIWYGGVPGCFLASEGGAGPPSDAPR